MSILRDFFKIEKYKTSVSREVQAGFVLFMTVAYVFTVHPLIMSACGIPMNVMVVITALIAGLSTLGMSLYANKPFVLLPLMGLNAFFVFTLVNGYGIPWQEALGMVFIAGILFIILSFLKVREMVANVLPTGLKNALTVSVGLFLTGLGMSNIGLIDFKNGNLCIGDLRNSGIIVACITLFVIIGLMVLKVRSALFIGIIVGTVVGIPLGITHIPDSFITLPPSISDVAFKLDILGALKVSNMPYIFILFYGNFVVTLSLLMALGVKAGYMDENGNFPDISKPFLVDACATAVGGLLGTSPVGTYVESAAGVEAGGRTGLASLTASLLFFLMIFFVPLAVMIPTAATAPVLIVIGMLMMVPVKDINFGDIKEAFPAFLVIIFSAFTFDIAFGISLGILSHIFIKIVTGQPHKVHWSLYTMGILMIYYLVSTI